MVIKHPKYNDTVRHLANVYAKCRQTYIVVHLANSNRTIPVHVRCDVTRETCNGVISA